MVGESTMETQPSACNDGCLGFDPAVLELASGSSAAWAPDLVVPVMHSAPDQPSMYRQANEVFSSWVGLSPGLRSSRLL